MERIEKIKILRSVLQGKVSANDLRPKSFYHKIGVTAPDGTETPHVFMINGKEVSHAEYSEQLMRDPDYRSGTMKINVITEE